MDFYDRLQGRTAYRQSLVSQFVSAEHMGYWRRRSHTHARLDNLWAETMRASKHQFDSSENIDWMPPIPRKSFFTHFRWVCVCFVCVDDAVVDSLSHIQNRPTFFDDSISIPDSIRTFFVSRLSRFAFVADTYWTCPDFCYDRGREWKKKQFKQRKKDWMKCERKIDQTTAMRMTPSATQPIWENSIPQLKFSETVMPIDLAASSYANFKGLLFIIFSGGSSSMQI